MLCLEFLWLTHRMFLVLTHSFADCFFSVIQTHLWHTVVVHCNLCASRSCVALHITGQAVENCDTCLKESFHPSTHTQTFPCNINQTSFTSSLTTSVSVCCDVDVQVLRGNIQLFCSFRPRLKPTTYKTRH